MKTLAICNELRNLCGSGSCARLRQSMQLSHKADATIPEIAWQSGRLQQQRQQPPSPRKSRQRQAQVRHKLAEHPIVIHRHTQTTDRREHRGLLYGDAHPVYSQAERSPVVMPRFVPTTTKMHDALAMPITRRGIQFNPWTILLELLYDPRLEWEFNNDKLLIAIGHLNWVHMDNAMAQRPLIASYLFRTGCIRAKESVSTQLPNRILNAGECQGTDLSPAQLTALCQIQWPRYIDQMMHETARASSTDWNSAWLSANLSMLELQAAFKRTRVVFGTRLDLRKQFSLLVRSSFEHSPGLALNALMGWGGKCTEFLTPYSAIRLTSAYFPNVEVARQRIGEAWAMFDFLIYCNQHVPPPGYLDQELPSEKRGCLRGDTGYAGDLFASLQAFDHWQEAAKIINGVYQYFSADNNSEPSCMQELHLDHLLIERYLSLYPSQSKQTNM